MDNGDEYFSILKYRSPPARPLRCICTLDCCIANKTCYIFYLIVSKSAWRNCTPYKWVWADLWCLCQSCIRQFSHNGFSCLECKECLRKMEIWLRQRNKFSGFYLHNNRHAKIVITVINTRNLYTLLRHNIRNLFTISDLL